MSLTGAPFIVLLGVTAVLALAGAVRLAPRASRSVAARIALLLAGQLCLLPALLAAANAYFSFYGSWSELLGTSAPKAGTAGGRPDGGAGDPAFRPLVPVRDPFVVRNRLPAGDGRLEAVAIRGPRSGITARAYVYLPAQYLRDPARRFPVNIALTGYPGNAQNLITRLRLPRIAAAEIAAGRAKPMIFVMLRPTVTPPRDTECTDVPGGPAAETFFAQDLPAALRSAYRVVTGPDGWSVLGDSTGGYCALKLAMRHSDRFGAAVSLAGYYHALKDFTTGDLYGGSRAYRDENDLLWRLRRLPAPPVDVLVTTSRIGERNYPDTRRFIALVRAPMRVASITLPSGGHHFRVWSRELVPALRWLSDRPGT